MPPFFSNKVKYNPFDTMIEVNRFKKAPLKLFYKMLYPRIYRVDNCMKYDEEQEGVKIRHVGLIDELTEEVRLPLTGTSLYDAMDFKGIFIVDCGFELHTLIMGEVPDEKLETFFGVQWKDVGDVKSWDENNKNEENVRVLNILTQLREDNYNENLKNTFHVLTFVIKKTRQLHGTEVFEITSRRED